MCVWLLLPAHITRSLPPLHITLSSLVHWCPLPTVARKTMPWTTAHNHNCCKQKRQQLGVTSRFKKVCVNTVSYGFIWFYVWFVSAHHSFAQGSRFRTLAVFGCFCLTEMPWYAGSISLWFKSIYNHLYVADIGHCFEPKINSPEVDWHLSKWLFVSTMIQFAPLHIRWFQMIPPSLQSGEQSKNHQTACMTRPMEAKAEARLVSAACVMTA